jgi:hypothetical protein
MASAAAACERLSGGLVANGRAYPFGRQQSRPIGSWPMRHHANDPIAKLTPTNAKKMTNVSTASDAPKISEAVHRHEASKHGGYCEAEAQQGR